MTVEGEECDASENVEDPLNGDDGRWTDGYTARVYREENSGLVGGLNGHVQE